MTVGTTCAICVVRSAQALVVRQDPEQRIGAMLDSG
jgi:hypothetical protein